MTDFPKIFLVDDDPFCLTLYEQEILNLGFENVETLSSGAALLSRLSEEPDLIFLDYKLADYNGLQLLKKINEYNPDISVVMISGQQDMQITVQVMNEGAFDYIIKDEFESTKIVRLIGRWLSAHEYNTELKLSAGSGSADDRLKLITMTQEKVRSEISGELHDNVSQLLGASKLFMEVAFRDDLNRLKMIEESRLILDSAISEVRKLSHSLQARSLQVTDLAVELDKLTGMLRKQSGFKLFSRVNINGLHERLAAADQLEVFRIIQELVNNINKYANAAEVKIKVELATEKLLIMVSDDGIGFEFDKVKKGLGLDNILKRIANINGRYTVNTSPGQGCCWQIEIPVQAAHCKTEKQLLTKIK